MATNTVNTDDVSAKKAKMRATILGIIYSIVINAIFPIIIFQVLKRYTSLSDFWALVISGVPPILDTIIGIARKGQVDIIAGIALLSIVVSIILIVFGGSPRLLLIRESYFTGAFGLAYLVSLLFPRPLGFYFARHFVTGNVPEKVANFNNLWQYPGFRYAMRLTTLVWGIVFVLEVTVRTYLVFTLTIAQSVVILPFVWYAAFGGVMLWTLLYSRRGRKQADEAQARRTTQEAAEPKVADVDETVVQ